jgi:hypothetical protein
MDVRGTGVVDREVDLDLTFLLPALLLLRLPSTLLLRGTLLLTLLFMALLPIFLAVGVLRPLLLLLEAAVVDEGVAARVFSGFGLSECATLRAEDNAVEMIGRGGTGLLRRAERTRGTKSLSGRGLTTNAVTFPPRPCDMDMDDESTGENDKS